LGGRGVVGRKGGKWGGGVGGSEDWAEYARRVGEREVWRGDIIHVPLRVGRLGLSRAGLRKAMRHWVEEHMWD